MRGSKQKSWLVKIIIIFTGLLVAGRVLWMCCRMVKSLQTRRSAVRPLGTRREILLILMGLCRGLDSGFIGLMKVLVLYMFVLGV